MLVRHGPLYPRLARQEPVAQLGRLRIVRNCLTKTCPGLCTGCPDVQHRLKLRRIVQRGETNGHDSWGNLATREQGRTAFGAKAASRETTAASTNRVRLRRAGDRCVRHLDDEAGSERSATGALAVPAVAVEHRDWRARAHVADRAACTSAGEWSGHVVVSSCRLTNVREVPVPAIHCVNNSLERGDLRLFFISILRFPRPRVSASSLGLPRTACQERWWGSLAYCLRVLCTVK